jgi:UDP-glucose 4-epimerase
MQNAKKAIVTGGAGFIGSHIAEELIKLGYQTVIIDDFSSGSLDNIQHLAGQNLKYIRGSITNLPLLQEYFQNADYVFHEAAIASVPKSMENPSYSHEVNVTGALNVLIAARDCKVKKVILASSSAVYGNTPALYKKEDMVPSPLSIYAINKLTDEYYSQIFTSAFGLPTVCLRYFNVFGPRQSPDSDYAAVIPKFLCRIKKGQELPIYGDGEQSRDFVYVKDVVSANLIFAQNEANGVFNIGSGDKVTINKLLETMSLITGDTNLRITHTLERQADIKHSLADISQARKFGYNPRYNLTDGLKEMLEN